MTGSAAPPYALAVNQTSTTPFPEVPETEATGATAEIYAGLRRTSGAALAPLIYRHLATFPGGLEWTWGVIGPFMDSGELPARADRVAEMAVTSELPGLQKAVLDLRLGADGLAAIAKVLDLYNRANPINIIAVKLARFVLAGETPEAVSAAMAAPPEGKPLAVIPAPPHIVRIEAMAPDLAALVGQLSSPGATAGDRIVPGLYRHLANWPPYLAVAAQALLPHYQAGAVAEAAGRVRAHADAEAAGAWARLDRNKIGPEEPEGDIRAQMIASLDAFVARIPEMVVVGAMLRGAMPATD